MSKKVTDQINDEIYTGIIPALSEDRIYDAKAITIAAAGFGVASWCYVQGGWIASSIRFPISIIVSIVPLILFGLIMMFCVIIPTRHGIDLWIYQRAVFGYNFCSVLCIVAILTNWGWYALNCKVFGTASSSLLKLMGVNVSSAALPWLATFCAILGFVLAMNGPHLMKYSTYIMVPCLIGVGVLLIFKTLSTTSFSQLSKAVPMYAKSYANTKVAFLCMVEAMFGFVFSWYPVLGSMSRITKTEKASYWGQGTGYIVAMAFFVVIGVLSSTLMGMLGTYSTDPTDWLMKLNSPVWSALSILAIALANITTQTLGCYCLSLATKIFKPSWNYKIISACYTVLVVFMIFWQGIWNYYNMFLAVTAIIGAPACAIILVDYFIIRKGKFSMRSTFMIDGKRSYKYTFGFNVPAFIAFLLAIVSYISIYDPIKYVVHNAILMKFTPTGVAFFIAGVVYFLFYKIPSIKAYILKDKDEMLEEETKRQEKLDKISSIV